jgi:hypothetical protein
LFEAIQENADALPRGLFMVRETDGTLAGSWLLFVNACGLPSPRLLNADPLILRFEVEAPQLMVLG